MPCVSEKLAAKLGAHFDGTQVVYSMRRGARARVADGREMSIQEQTRVMHVTVLTRGHPWR